MSKDDSLFSEFTASEHVEGHLTEQQSKLVAKGQKAAAMRIESPGAVGDYEKRAREAAAGLAPLLIGAGPKHHAAEDGTPLTSYENQYNSYIFPLRATLRALGRLDDLSRAGAPLEPQLADKALFPKLSSTKKTVGKVDHGDAQAAYRAWSAQQSDLRISVMNQAASDMKLQAALTKFQGAQYKMSRMRKEAQKQADETRRAQIDDTINTLVKIVDVTQLALGKMSEVEGLINMTWSPSDVDPELVGKSEADQKAIDEALAAGKTTKSLPQRAADHIASALKVDVSKAKGWLSGAGFNAHDLFMVATGNAGEYDRLTTEINKLDGQIKNLGVDIEVTEIKEAHQLLEGFQMDFTVSGQAVRSKAASAREGAASTGQQLGAGREGVMTMYVANAYEELALFGSNADQDRRKLEHRTGKIAGYLRDSTVKLQYADRGWAVDYDVLSDNIQSVWNDRDYFKDKLPEWQERARAWETFLKEMTGTDLVK